MPVPPDAADQPTPSAASPDEDFPTPHKTFEEHFTNPLYADQGEELAPFGSDKGADMLWVPMSTASSTGPASR